MTDDQITYWGGEPFPADLWGKAPKRGESVRIVQEIVGDAQALTASRIVDALIAAGLIEKEMP